MMKKQSLSEECKRMQKLAGIITESGSSAFNDAGEPMMTHQQYRDYSEPSEEDYSEEDYDDDHKQNITNEFIQEMKKNNIFVETFNGDEYFVRCKGNEDFMIYFINNDTIEIYDTSTNQKKEFNFEDAVDYTLSNKDKLYSFEESIKSRNRESEIDDQDKKNNRSEMGDYGLG